MISGTRPASLLSCSTAALSDDATSFALGRAAPHALLLTRRQSVLEARDADVALITDCFGDVGLFLLVGVEHPRIEPPAGPKFPPNNRFG